MKKIILNICLLFTTLSLSACDLLNSKSDSEIMLEVFDDVIYAIDNNDTDYLYSLFSKNTQGEVFDDCQSSIDYFQGEFISITRYGSLIVSNDKYDELKTTEYKRTLTTTVSIFYISIKYFAIHSLDDDAIGISYFYVLEHDGTKDVQFTAPLLWIPGVSLGLDGL